MNTNWRIRGNAFTLEVAHCRLATVYQAEHTGWAWYSILDGTAANAATQEQAMSDAEQHVRVKVGMVAREMGGVV
jgi:hypothetical protein